MGTGKKTRITILLDETGSMANVKQQTVSGMNEYIETVAAELPDAELQIITFNSAETSVLRPVKRASKIAEISTSEYKPRFLTPLNDAIMEAILLTKCSTRKNFIFVILTDGKENASTEYNTEAVFSTIAELKKSGWTFVFMGADQDAYIAGGGYGINRSETLSFSSGDMRTTIKSAGMSTVSYALGETKTFFEDKD